jgi:hypothetical protein
MGNSFSQALQWTFMPMMFAGEELILILKNGESIAADTHTGAQRRMVTWLS